MVVTPQLLIHSAAQPQLRSSDQVDVIFSTSCPLRYVIVNLLSIAACSSLAESASADNFHSPQNVGFYASKPYIPLGKAHKQIRLIRISPGDRGHALERDFLPPQRLEEARNRYLAVFYCAGDPKITALVRVNGREFNAFVNLEAALRTYQARQGNSLSSCGRIKYALTRAIQTRKRIKF